MWVFVVSLAPWAQRVTLFAVEGLLTEGLSGDWSQGQASPGCGLFMRSLVLVDGVFCALSSEWSYYSQSDLCSELSVVLSLFLSSLSFSLPCLSLSSVLPLSRSVLVVPLSLCLSVCLSHCLILSLSTPCFLGSSSVSICDCLFPSLLPLSVSLSPSLASLLLLPLSRSVCLSVCLSLASD